MKKSKKQFIFGLVLGVLILSLEVTQAEETDPSVLEPMIVTATRHEKKDLDIPAATQVITNQEIKEMGAKTLIEVIKNMPDFVVSLSTSGNGLPGFRGITGYLTIMINGIPLANEGYFQLGSIATAGIERVEIIKGGSAVLYGSDATTGVINVITKKDGDNSVSIGAGNKAQRQFTTFLHQGGLSLSYDHFQEKERGLIAQTDSKDYYGDKVKTDNINLNYEFNDHLNFMFFHSKRESIASKYLPNTRVSAGEPWDNETIYDIGQASFTNENLRVLLYGQGREWTYENPTGKQKGRYYGVDIQDKWDFGRLSLTAGGNYDHEKSSRMGSDDWIPNTKDRGALFFLTETDLFSATKLVLGAREVLSNTSDNVFCPQFQVLQHLSENDSLYLNVNKSLREPNLSQIYGYSATQVPNEDLQSELGWTYEIGWKKQFTKSNMLKFALYHMTIDGRIYSSKTAAGETIYLNASKFKNTGTELNYEHTASQGLFYGTGLTYMSPEQKAEANDEWEKTAYQFGMHLNIGYRLSSAMVNLMANHRSMRAEDTDHLWDVSLNASYDLTDKDRLRLNVSNLLDRDDSISAGGICLLEDRNFLLTYERSF